jgi:hypothetical protein
MYGKALNEARVRYSDSFSIGLKICYIVRFDNVKARKYWAR